MLQHLPSVLPLSDVPSFRSFAHGVRIVGFCSDAQGEGIVNGQEESGVESKKDGNLPSLIPEILDMIGSQLLDRLLLRRAQTRK